MIAYFAHYECKNLTKAYLILLSNFAVYANDPEMKAIIQIIARNAKSMTQDVIIEFINDSMGMFALHIVPEKMTYQVGNLGLSLPVPGVNLNLCKSM